MIRPGTTIKAEIVPAVPTEVLAWAREELRLDGATTLAAHRAALLKQVEIEGFQPNEAWQAAVDVVRAEEAERAAEADRAGAFARSAAVAALHVAAPFLGPVEAKLREQIAALRTGFFELKPDQRRERWHLLWDESAPFPALRKQLATFEPALDWTPDQMQSESPAVHDMARHLARLFTLSPAERGQQRHLPAVESSTNPREWQQAAPELAKDYPQVAQFDGVFVRRLAEAHEANKPLSKIKREAGKLRSQFKAKGSPKVQSLHAGPWVWVVIGVALGGMRLLVNDWSSQKPKVNYALTDTQRQQRQTSAPSTRPRAGAGLNISQEEIEQAVLRIREKKRRERLPEGHPSKKIPVQDPQIGEALLKLMGVPADALDPDKPNPYERKPVEQRPVERKRERQPKLSDTSQAPIEDPSFFPSRWQRPLPFSEHVDQHDFAVGMKVLEEVQRRRQQQPQGQSAP